MPELPEVETVMRGLEPVITGQRITSADIRRPDLRWPFPPDMSARLAGAGIERLWRRSKYILADLSTGETLIVHLGMSGRILISGQVQGEFHHPLTPAAKHDHVVLDFENGARITFNDPRRFGAMDLASSRDLARHRMLRNLGPEPLGNQFHEDYIEGAFKGRRTPVKSALLDQRLVAGLGNIYVCEALHRAGISPVKHAWQLTRTEIGRLVPAIVATLNDAIAAGGSSLRDFRHTDGELGYFQHEFRVYDQEGNRCRTPECAGIISRITQSGRSTFFCPQCQN